MALLRWPLLHHAVRFAGWTARRPFRYYSRLYSEMLGMREEDYIDWVTHRGSRLILDLGIAMFGVAAIAIVLTRAW